VTNEYHFITRWRVRATVEEVFDLISNPLDFPRWWPSVYLTTEMIEPPNERGAGRRIRYHTKGWLPYTIRWEATTLEFNRPTSLALRATGDFDGRGIWTIRQDGEFADATYDWKLTADKPLLRRLSFLFKPAFAANHRWAMARGRESLELELARRHANTEEERSRIPAPGLNHTSGVWLGLGILLVVLALIAVLWLL